VQQKLIVVEATYLLPVAATAASTGTVGGSSGSSAALGYGDTYGKLCEDASTLIYHDRRAYVRGLSEVRFVCRLSMEQEWRRDDRWSDWSGRSFSSLGEWVYVTEEAAVESETPVGLHEKGRGGWRLVRFMESVNAQVVAAGGEALTRDEVISVRLYTGPGYQQINNAFLRAVGNVPSQRWRQRLSQIPSFTYSATVGHLVSAITKLSVLSTFEAGEQEKLLYRGVSGKLASSFFEADAQGMIAAVDAGMMSTG
jgi:hypothetical protein